MKHELDEIKTQTPLNLITTYGLLSNYFHGKGIGQDG